MNFSFFFFKYFLLIHLIYFIRSGGHVTLGGAICIELLTTDGWSSVYTVEAIIMQISSTLVEGGGRIHEQSKVFNI